MTSPIYGTDMVSIIGLHLDTWHGTLSLYEKRRCIGLFGKEKVKGKRRTSTPTHRRPHPPYTHSLLGHQDRVELISVSALLRGLTPRRQLVSRGLDSHCACMRCFCYSSC
ncbi:uncharacterized protein spsb3b [Electrophorus electricus]|uniref:uncharacterized protein spsb3b n=1 Tax=Electrophorus electricus TaxID=8005 RepID=UPI0015CF995F|nr:uncharacterized protein spsb3b [Electrophorus electricus]XP_035386656.1 uncharacterized protein spsb3b [Electrophorus electricus]XP_035386657.1 uncharacterized protein spsb3b [Electrophorus electricus]XP_035386658.1 uncharacterized protein spsb3b [Electrophorus electricus]XP_035386659.1 uncharacterized protein spsb3b [Electrophorus electricus]XP_035386660.1 uncharacterized protein spsb3b [Electrophorus electricus]